jgi:Short C-terminal domain
MDTSRDRVDEASDQLARNDTKAALKALDRAYYDVQRARDLGGVRRARAVAQRISEIGDGRTKRKAEEYVRWFGELESSYSGINPLQAAMERLGVQGDDPDRRLVPGCTLVGGYGYDIEVGSAHTLVTYRDGVALIPRLQGDPLTIDYDAIVTFEIGGPGRVTSHGGFAGGGLGLAGAAEGMIVASALNVLTTRTSVTSIIHIATPEGEIILHNGDAEPDGLRITLSPIAGRIAGRRSSPAPSTVGSSDPIFRLKQLKELRDEGLLTVDEFEAARARVARELG